MNDEETEELVLSRHSQKIASSYGLLMTDEKYVIVINKNLRICTDCHEFYEICLMTEDRKIIVSDMKCVHVFENGACFCNEYY